MAEKKSDNVDSETVSVRADASSSADAAGDGAKKKNTWFTDDEFEHFETILLERRKEAVDDIERMRAQLEDAREQAENDTAYSFHMADAGTDAMEREKLYLMIARQQKYVGYLDRALQRIEDRTYGVCKVSGKPISKERLEAVPHTEISIEAKLKQKK